jgi:hypothetical protein
VLSVVVCLSPKPASASSVMGFKRELVAPKHFYTATHGQRVNRTYWFLHRVHIRRQRALPRLFIEVQTSMSVTGVHRYSNSMIYALWVYAFSVYYTWRVYDFHSSHFLRCCASSHVQYGGRWRGVANDISCAYTCARSDGIKYEMEESLK